MVVSENTSLSNLRKMILKMSSDSQEGHIPSALSIIEIVWAFYSRFLNEQNLLDPSKERFILSKGHGSLALYVVLAELNYFPKEWLETFGGYNSNLGGHPDATKVPGVELSTGSLGHGLPISVGLALASKIQKKDENITVLIGDGELNEGSNWESFLLGAQHKLGNLSCIIDFNNSSARALSLGNLKEKMNAFGWKVLVIDGHDCKKLIEVFGMARSEIPLAIIANTVKGKGVPEMENNPAWHHAFPGRTKLNDLIKSIK